MVARIEFEREMSQLHEEIIRMGAQVEHAIEEAIAALIDLDAKRAQVVIEQDDIVDEMERNIDGTVSKSLPGSSRLPVI